MAITLIREELWGSPANDVSGGEESDGRGVPLYPVLHCYTNKGVDREAFADTCARSVRLPGKVPRGERHR